MATMTERPPLSVSLPEEPPAKPYHAKRPHKKSRSGCKSCKARKVKCDEVRPQCRHCKQRKTDCIYPNPPALATTSTPTAHQVSPSPSPSPSPNHVESTAPSPNSTAVSGPSALVLSSAHSVSQTCSVVAEPLYRPAGIDEVDMKLLWFYTTKTSCSFSIQGEEQTQSIMRNMLVRYAFETPFLMNSVFALSSLHLQNLNQQFDPSRALVYRIKSFEGFRKAVKEAKPENYPALVANSLFLTAISSQNFRDPDAEDLYILDWLVVWRGIGLMINLVSIPILIKTGLDCLFYRPTIDLDKATSSIPNHLLFMVSSIKSDDPDYPHKQTYYDTLKYVGGLCMHLRQGICPEFTLRVITIFTFIPTDFAELARDRRPRALIILAHLAGFLKVIQHDMWWVEGIGQRTLKDICNYLGPKWHHLLKTPFLALGVEDRIDIARVLLEDPSWVSNMPSGQLFLPTRLWVDDMGRALRLNEDGEVVTVD